MMRLPSKTMIYVEYAALAIGIGRRRDLRGPNYLNVLWNGGSEAQGATSCLTMLTISVIVGNNLHSLVIRGENEIRRLGSSPNQIVWAQIEALSHSKDSPKARALNPAF
jgi:hypothetical protein